MHFINADCVTYREAFFGDKRYVAFFDYHIERVDAKRFSTLLGELDAAVKQQALRREPEYE